MSLEILNPLLTESLPCRSLVGVKPLSFKRVRRQSLSSADARCRHLERMVESVADLLPLAGIVRAGAKAGSSRKITLYLCHVMLGVSQVKLAKIFGLSRTVVREACQSIENRRDDRHLDDVLEIVGRLARDAVSSHGAAR